MIRTKLEYFTDPVFVFEIVIYSAKINGILHMYCHILSKTIFGTNNKLHT